MYQGMEGHHRYMTARKTKPVMQVKVALEVVSAWPLFFDEMMSWT
jgi:hypothetical protein